MLNNTIEWKTYQASNLFGKSTLAKYHSPDTLIEDSNGYEYICATNKNNGINQSLSIVNGSNLSLTPKKIISWGKQCPNFTYHENECVACQGIYYIQTNSISKYAAQFLCTIFNNICKNQFNYSNCLIGSKFDNLQIKLPSILKLTPDFESLGKIVGGGGTDMSNIDTSSWKEFKLSELFESESGDFDIKKEHINGFGVDVVTAGETNNGVLGKSNIDAKIIDGNTITIDMFGKCTYRNDCYKMVTHARVFSLKCLFDGFNETSGLYITTVLQRLVNGFSYSNMCSWNKIKDLSIKLPAIETYEPDWQYMEEYMKNIESEVTLKIDKFQTILGNEKHKIDTKKWGGIE